MSAAQVAPTRKLRISFMINAFLSFLYAGIIPYKSTNSSLDFNAILIFSPYLPVEKTYS
jgi:hypothetical protein